MHKKLLLLLALSIALPIFAESITITALDNPQPTVTSQARQGAELAISVINKRGGVLGQKLALVANDSAKNTANFHRLDSKTTGDSLASLAVNLGDSTLVQNRVAKMLSEGSVVLSPSSFSPQLQAQLPQHLFVTSFNDPVEAAAAAQYIMTQMHLARAFILYQPNMATSASLTHNFSAAYQHLKGSVVGSAALTNGKITPEVEDKINSAHPNILYLVVESARVVPVIKQLRAAYDQPIMATSSVDAEQVIPLGKSIADNIYYTTPGFFDSNFMDDNLEKFVKAYQQKYNKKPSNIDSALAYDNIQLLAAAISKAKSTEPMKVASALKSITKFQGAVGDLDMSQIPPTTIVTVVKILNAKARTAAMVIPQYIPK